MLILRIAFWVAVVAMLLPSAPSTAVVGPDGTPLAEEANFDPAEAVTLAMTTSSDVLGFCDRNRTVCDAAGDAGEHVLAQVIYYSGEAVSWAAEKLLSARQPVNGAANSAPVSVLAPPPAQGI